MDCKPKKNRSIFIIYLLLCFFIIVYTSCTTTLKLTTTGGFGKDVNDINYIYEVQNLKLEDLFSGIYFKIQVKKYDEQYLVEPSLNYIINCFKKEIEDNRGIIFYKNNNNLIYDILIDIIISKYITRKFGKNYYKTFIDIEYHIVDNISSKKIISNAISVSGRGESATKSNLIAIKKVINNILLNEKFLMALSQIHCTENNIISHSLNKLSQSLLKDFEINNYLSNKQYNISFLGFKNDENFLFTNVFLTSLKKFWKEPKYNFFSRDQIDKILIEYKLSMTGIVENKSFLRNLELKSVDLIIVGKVSKIKKQYIIEAEIINIQNGEIITSKTVTINL